MKQRFLKAKTHTLKAGVFAGIFLLFAGAVCLILLNGNNLTRSKIINGSYMTNPGNSPEDFSSGTRQEAEDQFRKFSKTYKQNIPLEIVSDYYDKIGPEKLLDVIEEEPYCHSKGHNVGRVIYNKTGDLGRATQICSSRCYTGCFHGVLMGLFGEDEYQNDEVETLNKFTTRFTTLCDEKDISSKVQRGVCIHGIGHALLFMADYDIQKALNFCGKFPGNGEEYYCATGVFMERSGAKGAEDLKTGKYYPCDKFNFPAGCFRWKIGDAFKSDEYILAQNYCLELPDGYMQNGCFHGLGFRYYKVIGYDPEKLADICLVGTEMDRKMCIEGAMGILAEYGRDKALGICEVLRDDTLTSSCRSAVKVGNYGMSRNFGDYYQVKY